MNRAHLNICHRNSKGIENATTTIHMHSIFNVEPRKMNNNAVFPYICASQTSMMTHGRRRKRVAVMGRPDNLGSLYQVTTPLELTNIRGVVTWYKLLRSAAGTRHGNNTLPSPGAAPVCHHRCLGCAYIRRQGATLYVLEVAIWRRKFKAHPLTKEMKGFYKIPFKFNAKSRPLDSAIDHIQTSAANLFTVILTGMAFRCYPWFGRYGFGIEIVLLQDELPVPIRDSILPCFLLHWWTFISWIYIIYQGYLCVWI